MAFKSTAQRDRLRKLEDAGKVPKGTYDKAAEGTPDELPERVQKKNVKTRVKPQRKIWPS
jgi:hypothetical protein